MSTSEGLRLQAQVEDQRRENAALRRKIRKLEADKKGFQKTISDLTQSYAAAVLRLQKLGVTDVPLKLAGPKGWWCPECEVYNEEKDVDAFGACSNCGAAELWHVQLIEINEK